MVSKKNSKKNSKKTSKKISKKVTKKDDKKIMFSDEQKEKENKRCGTYDGDDENCKSNNCWYNYRLKKCGIHYNKAFKSQSEIDSYKKISKKRRNSKKSKSKKSNRKKSKKSNRKKSKKRSKRSKR